MHSTRDKQDWKDTAEYHRFLSEDTKERLWMEISRRARIRAANRRRLQRRVCLLAGTLTVGALAAGLTLNQLGTHIEPVSIPAESYAESFELITAEPVVPPSQPNPTPLDESEFVYLTNRCEMFEVDVALVLAVIERESSFRADAQSATGDYGLMQINVINHPRMRELFGEFWNPLYAKDSIDAGVHMLSELLKQTNGDVHYALMCYNMGAGGAGKARRAGYSSTTYSRDVLSKRDVWRQKLESEVDGI